MSIRPVRKLSEFKRKSFCKGETNANYFSDKPDSANWRRAAEHGEQALEVFEDSGDDDVRL